MRKIYAYLTAVLVFFLLLHGICGSYVLIGIGKTGAPIFAKISLGLLVIHAAFGLFFTARTLWRQVENGRPFYLWQNRLFWLRRLSGLAILCFLWCHFTLFGEMQGDTYVVHAFTTGRFLLHLGLWLSVSIHVLTNIKPLYVALGFTQVQKRTADTTFVCAVLLVLMLGMAVLYFLGLGGVKL